MLLVATSHIIFRYARHHLQALSNCKLVTFANEPDRMFHSSYTKHRPAKREAYVNCSIERLYILEMFQKQKIIETNALV